MPSAVELERLFNLVVDPLCIAGFDGYFKQINPAWARTLGYTDTELLSKPYLAFVHPDDVAATVGAAAKVANGVTVLEFRNRYRAKDGTYRWLAWNAFPSAEEQLVYACARDITDLKRREEHQYAVYRVTHVLATATRLEEAATEILKVVCEVLDWDVGAVWHVDEDAEVIRCVQFWQVDSIDVPGFAAKTKQAAFGPGIGLPGRVWSTNEPHWISEITVDPNFPRAAAARKDGLHGAFGFPIRTAYGVIGIIEFFSRCFREPDAELLELFDAVGSQVGQFIDRLKAEAGKQAAERQTKEVTEHKLYLEEELRSEYGDIVGESAPLKHVLDQIQTVAETDATVLILGETGTGKELIARAVHNQSDRRSRTFVKLNCSAIPTGLLESELFGHERGAFTGAIAQKIGRLELADRGSLFLDEIGDIPTELQPQLLRALQEREFERLGSNRTIKADVRLIAATNRDLSQMVANREFRSDLYYRLNVFPVRVPPLRERAEDIPRLVRHFAQKYAQRMNKRILTIPTETMRALTRWQWPGNIRELENFIERAVILSSGTVLEVPISELQSASATTSAASTPAAKAVAAPPGRQPATLADHEREHILKILRETKGVLSGPHGAASRLGLKRTTLQAKMKKLGIGRDSI